MNTDKHGWKTKTIFKRDSGRGSGAVKTLRGIGGSVIGEIESSIRRGGVGEDGRPVHEIGCLVNDAQTVWPGGDSQLKRLARRNRQRCEKDRRAKGGVENQSASTPEEH